MGPLGHFFSSPIKHPIVGKLGSEGNEIFGKEGDKSPKFISGIGGVSDGRLGKLGKDSAPNIALKADKSKSKVRSGRPKSPHTIAKTTSYDIVPG